MTKGVYFKAAGHVVLGTVVASLGLALSSFASTTPFNEDFEGFSHNQDVDGSNGWETKAVGSATDITGVALAQSNVVYSGARSLVVTNADLLNDFSDDKTNIWTEIYTRPVFGQQADVPADASVVFYINSTGTVVAFSNTVAVPLDHTPIASNTFVRFRAHTDHAAETYDLYLGSTKIADTFGFYSAVNADYNTFMVRAGSGTNGMYLDDIEISGVSPFFQIVSNPAAGVSVQMYVGAAAQDGVYKILKKDLGESSFGVLVTGTNSSGQDPFPIVDSTFVGGSAVTRLYKLVDANAATERTNETVWIANKQPRTSNSWHMVSVPANGGAGTGNRLSGFAGTRLAEQLEGDNTEALAPLVYIHDGASFSEVAYLDAGDTWRVFGGGGVAASNDVDPGEGVWIKAQPDSTGPDAGREAILTGQAHTNSTQISMTQSNWILFAWPFPESQLNTAGTGTNEQGWGFMGQGFPGGSGWDDASRMFIEDDGQFYNLYMSTSGIWNIQNTESTAGVKLQTGKAYYFFNTGATKSFLATPAN